MAAKHFEAPLAPAALGPYSHAVRVGNLIFLSGQIGLRTSNMELNNPSFEVEVQQVFENVQAVLQAADADFSHIVKLTVYLLDLSNFATVNAVMSELFSPPYPARAAVGVSALPRAAAVEIEAIAHVP